MDSNLVFHKTPAGKEVFTTPRHSLKRSLRRVLIMVDGVSTTGEIGALFGNLEIVLNTLEELHKTGMVETAAEHWIREAQEAKESEEQEPRKTVAAFVPEVEQQPANPVAGGTEPAAAEENIPVLDLMIPQQKPEAEETSRDSFFSESGSGQIDPASVDKKIEKTAETPAAVSRPRQEEEISEPATGFEATEEEQPHPIAEEVAAQPEFENYDSLRPPVAGDNVSNNSGMGQAATDALSHEEIDRWINDQTRPGGERSHENGSGGFEQNSSVNAPQKPVRDFSALLKPLRALRFKLPGIAGAQLLKIVIGALLLVVLSAVFFPIGQYQPEAERLLSQFLGQPTKIGQIRLSYWPRPGIVLDEVKAGETGELTAAAIHLSPALASLFSDRLVIHELRAERVTMKNLALERRSQPEPVASQGRTVLVERLHVDNLAVEIGDVRLENLSGEAQLETNRIGELALQNDAGTLKLKIVPQRNEYKLKLSATAWRMPFKPAWLFETLEAEGKFDAKGMRLDKLDGKLYGGWLEGGFSLTWRPVSDARATLKFKGIDLEKLFNGVDLALSLQGDIHGKFTAVAVGQTLSTLPDGLRAEGSFATKNGQINHFDFVQATRSGSRNASRGGVTKFEEFSGRVRYEQQAYQFSNLNLISGVMKTEGGMNIGKNQELTGGVTVTLKGASRVVRTPVRIGGKLKDPELFAGSGG